MSNPKGNHDFYGAAEVSDTCSHSSRVRVTGYKFEVILTPKEVESLNAMAEREGETVEEFIQENVKRAAKSARYELKEQERYREMQQKESISNETLNRLASVLDKIEAKLG